MSADSLDIAADNAQTVLDAQIATQRAAGEQIKVNGVCHWCDEMIAPPKKFCDDQCAAAWAKKRELEGRAKACG